MSDQMTYILPGDIAPRRGPKHLANSVAFRVQGGRVIPDPEPVTLKAIEPAPPSPEPVAEAIEQPAARRGRPRKTEEHADQA